MAHELPPAAAAAQDLGWPDFPAPPPPPATSALLLDNNNNNNNMPSWINDDFDEFSTAKRRAHRPSFERFDEEAQLIMSMFDNEQIKDDDASDGPATNSSSGPVASSSANGKKRCHRPEVKTEHEEVESSTCKDGAPVAEATTVSPSPPPPPAAESPDTVSDPKRVKRILANRQSARRSRVRKLQYISELERNLTTLQTEVSMLSPRVQYLDHQRLILNADNSTLKSKIAALAQDNIFKDAHQEALRREIERLKQIYQQQQNINTTPTSSPPSSAQAPT